MCAPIQYIPHPPHLGHTRLRGGVEGVWRCESSPQVMMTMLMMMRNMMLIMMGESVLAMSWEGASHSL
jgi:hypothetical protein